MHYSTNKNWLFRVAIFISSEQIFLDLKVGEVVQSLLLSFFNHLFTFKFGCLHTFLALQLFFFFFTFFFHTSFCFLYLDQVNFRLDFSHNFSTVRSSKTAHTAHTQRIRVIDKRALYTVIRLPGDFFSFFFRFRGFSFVVRRRIFLHC